MPGQLQRHVGDAIRGIRESRGLTQEAFAAQIGYDRSYYGKIERGERNLSLRALEQLAEALGVDPFDLFH